MATRMSVYHGRPQGFPPKPETLNPKSLNPKTGRGLLLPGPLYVEVGRVALSRPEHGG